MAQEIQETSIDQAPLPVYGDLYGKVDIEQDGFKTQARVAGKSSASRVRLVELSLYR